MPRGHELTPQLRSRICELRTQGFSHAKIKKAHPEIPLGTIKSTLRREAHRVDNQTNPRSGRPRAVTDETRDLINAVKKTNPNIKHRELLDLIGNVCKKRTLQMILREMALGSNAQNKAKRTKKTNGAVSNGSMNVQAPAAKVPGPPEPSQTLASSS
ncbi:transposase [Ilyonectria robusta]